MGSIPPFCIADTVSSVKVFFLDNSEKSAISISLFALTISVNLATDARKVFSSTVVSRPANSLDSCLYTAPSTPASPRSILTNGASIISLVRVKPVLPNFNPVLSTPPAISPSANVFKRCSSSLSASVSPNSATLLKNDSSPNKKLPSSVPTVRVAAASPVSAAEVLLTAFITKLPTLLTVFTPFRVQPATLNANAPGANAAPKAGIPSAIKESPIPGVSIEKVAFCTSSCMSVPKYLSDTAAPNSIASPTDSCMPPRSFCENPTVGLLPNPNRFRSGYNTVSFLLVLGSVYIN